jgi:ribosomal protein L40E
VDGAGDGLSRCPECGAVNPKGADVCLYCGAELPHRQQPARLIVAGQKLAEAVEEVSDQSLSQMTYRAVMQWAAGADGRFDVSRLERIAYARGYRSGWIYMQTTKTLDTVLDEIRLYSRELRKQI